MTFTFGGMTSEVEVNDTKIDSMFDGFYIYDKTLTHEDDDFSFNYTYAVEVLDKNEHAIDETIVSLYLTINEDSLSDSVKSSILSGDDFEINAYDTVTYGYGSVTIAYEEVPEGIDIDEYVKNIFSLVPAFDSLRGFYLDRAWNQIGTTGWDSVKYAIGLTDNLFNF